MKVSDAVTKDVIRRSRRIVTRADLVRAFVRPDDELEREIREDAERTLWIDPERLDIRVENGVVTLAGELEQRADAELLEKHVAAVPGVVPCGPI